MPNAVYVDEGMIQDAAYWAPTENNDGFGGIAYATVQLIKCRWEDVKGVMRDADGNEIGYDASVFPNVAVQEKGLLALGDFSGSLDSDGDLDHTTVAGAKEIRKVIQTPDLEESVTLYEALL